MNVDVVETPTKVLVNPDKSKAKVVEVKTEVKVKPVPTGPKAVRSL